MKSILEIAEQVENVVHLLLSADEETAFYTKEATLVGVSTDSNNEIVKFNPAIASDGDVYDLLQIDPQPLKGYDLVGVLTCGWAAPLPTNYNADDDLEAPSKHPEKRRVRLMAFADRSGEMASVLRFMDDQDNPISDDGGATGDLATALLEMIMRANAED
jgi:hypothetical protein